MTKLTYENIIDLKRVCGFAISPCESFAVVEVSRLDQKKSKYISDLWRVSFEEGVEPTLLTQGDSQDTKPAFRYDGSLVFLSDRKDSAQSHSEKDSLTLKQVWSFPKEGGDANKLTNEPLGVIGFQLAKHSDAFVVQANTILDLKEDEQRKAYQDRKDNGPSALKYTEMPVRFWDHWLQMEAQHLFLYKQNGENRTNLTPTFNRELFQTSFDVSPNGKYISYTKVVGYAENRLFHNVIEILDIENNQIYTLDLGSDNYLMAPKFSPDSEKIVFRAVNRPDGSPGKAVFGVYDFKDDNCQIYDSWDRWVSEVTWSCDGKALYLTGHDLGFSPVFHFDLSTKEINEVLSKKTGGTHDQISVSASGKVFGLRSSYLQPPEVFSYDKTSGDRAKILTSFSGITESELSECMSVENLSVKSRTGFDIQSFLLKPKDVEGPLPTLLWIHGGPMSSWQDTWHWRWNACLAISQGYAVVMPNPTGSTGFGQRFIEGIWGNNYGADCYHDLMDLMDNLEKRDDIDNKRIAAMGASFGGYMTNWIGSQTDRFRCLVTHASLFNLETFYGTTDLPAFWALKMNQYPFEDFDKFQKYSPSRYIKNWKSPTLIIHGEKDYRVPIGEGLALFEYLRSRDVEAELLVFPDENHWILKPRNIVEWYREIFQFVERHLN